MRSRANAKVQFQRRHFEAIAQIIREYGFNVTNKQEMAEHFASRLARTNANFNRDSFIHFAVYGEYPNETEARHKWTEMVQRRAERKAKHEARRDAKARREAAKPPFTLQELQKAAYQIVRDRNKALDKLES